MHPDSLRFLCFTAVVLVPHVIGEQRCSHVTLTEAYLQDSLPINILKVCFLIDLGEDVLNVMFSFVYVYYLFAR